MPTGSENMDKMLEEMKSIQAGIESEEQELAGKLELVRARKKRINAMIRAGEAESKPRQPRRKRRTVHSETQNKIDEALGELRMNSRIEDVLGSFTTRDLAEAAGLANSTANRAILSLRESGVIRQVGKIAGGPSGTPVYAMVDTNGN